MTYKQSLEQSRKRELVEDDKFENHIQHALIRDIISKRKIFTFQTEEGTNAINNVPIVMQNRNIE